MKVLAVLVLLGGTALAIGQDNYPDLPEHHSTYELMAMMRRLGAADSPYPMEMRSGSRTLTRSSVASWIARNVPRLPTFTASFVRNVRGDEPGRFDRYGPPAEARELLECLESFPYLLKGFQRELKASGVDVASFERIVKASAEAVRSLWKDAKVGSRMPFLDVPREHWAYRATSELKYLGLLRGYPSDRFSGS